MIHKNVGGSKQIGFTLIELMVSIAIIGFLASMSYISFFDIVAKARCVEVKTNFASYERMRTVSYQENGRVGATLSELGIVFYSRYFDYNEELLVTQSTDFMHSGTASNGVDKVTLCHIPPGNPDNVQIINVGNPAYDAHMAHGDNACETPADIPVILITSSDNTSTNSGNSGNGNGNGNGNSGGGNGNNSAATANNSASGGGSSASNSGAASGTGSSSASGSNTDSQNGSQGASNGSNSSIPLDTVKVTPDYNMTLNAIVKKHVGSKCTEGMGLYSIWTPILISHGDIGSGTCSYYMNGFTNK